MTSRYQKACPRNSFAVLLFACGLIAAPNGLYAHCDTLDGPVIKDARLALEKKDATPVLKWVKKEHENEITAAFKQALAARQAGSKAQEEADFHFFEALVRIHRAGEGASFSGLKPAGSVEPAIAEADKALESGKVEALTQELSSEIISGVKERFGRALEKSKHKDESVEAGREYVEAYVDYVHYIERLHKDISDKSHHAEHEGE